jgi:hypothetical protein
MVHDRGMILLRFDQAKSAGCQVLSSRHAGPVASAILETTGPLDGKEQFHLGYGPVDRTRLRLSRSGSSIPRGGSPRSKWRDSGQLPHEADNLRKIAQASAAASS